MRNSLTWPAVKTGKKASFQPGGMAHEASACFFIPCVMEYVQAPFRSSALFRFSLKGNRNGRQTLF
ncbi:hypothetical protein C5O10_06130 [Akkermansia muciniphila]|nr:hypothetical protein C5O09_06095 [Akkermansia muciniphila]QHV16418.1 hypothetical protein C5O10_06130 [Akkermansia muciniphila]